MYRLYTDGFCDSINSTVPRSVCLMLGESRVAMTAIFIHIIGTYVNRSDKYCTELQQILFENECKNFRACLVLSLRLFSVFLRYFFYILMVFRAYSVQ